MNIAIFTDCYLPIKNGVVTSVLQLKEGLEKKGHNVLIITIEVPNYDETDKNIYRLPSIYSGLGEQRFGIINQGAVNRFMKKKKIELVHTHTEFALGYCGKTVARKLNIPHIHTTHTLWEEYRHYIFNGKLLSRKMVRRIIGIFLKNVSLIIAPSIKAQKYNEDMFPEIPVEIVNNGIDVTKFKAKEVTENDISELKNKFNIKPNEKLLIFVGRIGKEKRVSELFDSVAPLIVKNKNIKIIFVGDGPALKDLKKRAKELELENNFVFTGFVSWDTVHVLYSMSNIFVTVSLSEVHPMTLIEASMCGLPLIVRKDDS
ncbi:MAG TPA: glycosyltransferase, partial [Spirochaetota bacterium]|nr:glycosyltransferase [Spirochaetota bacterium]